MMKRNLLRAAVLLCCVSIVCAGLPEAGRADDAGTLREPVLKRTPRFPPVSGRSGRASPSAPIRRPKSSRRRPGRWTLTRCSRGISWKTPRCTPGCAGPSGQKTKRKSTGSATGAWAGRKAPARAQTRRAGTAGGKKTITTS